MELLEVFHPKREKSTGKAAADADEAEKPPNIQLMKSAKRKIQQCDLKMDAERIRTNQIMPHEVVDEVTSVQTVSPHGSHGSAW